MNGIEWLPDSLVVPFVLVKAGVAFIAFLYTLFDMLSIWRRSQLLESAARRQGLYALLLASFLICWSSGTQISQLTDPESRVGFTLGYEHFLSIALCLLIIVAMRTTRREDDVRPVAVDRRP